MCQQQRTTRREVSNEKYKILTARPPTAAQGAARGRAIHPEPSLNAETRFAAGRSTRRRASSIARRSSTIGPALDPNHVPSLYRLGVMWTKTKQFDKAIPIWKRYIEATGSVARQLQQPGLLLRDGRRRRKRRGRLHGRDPARAPEHALPHELRLMLARQNRQVEAESSSRRFSNRRGLLQPRRGVWQQGAFARAKEELRRRSKPTQTTATRRRAWPICR